ncbi:TPR repeat [Rubrobacter radiotolerans]|uniref:TPR repeat n=1 Tax=Rubrobacter radiotolerans TaxID=42256 RepID=A0A023X0F7_RUBRA|nr:tetratricopeptide repeat protein [Rubrobacter radiotolerans]AHY45490.1 TPR repeat [Rubrobacter radiotolerans]MDX5892901.1 tetratricopeptide repeat protein [Rubrobacter radiotolerans]SMC02711.1 Tfp pilus assembly protein PilF [Rubrobacter radiotolerans DSM 5868]
MKHEELLEQGETLAEEGLLEEALSRFEQALESAPEDPEVLEAVGRALLNLGRLEEAEACYLDALELDPEWAAPRMGLALVAMRRDEPFKTVHHLERAIESDPEYPEAYVELGRYYGLMGEPALAKATFERWTKRHPEDADVLINAGLTSFDAGDHAQALVFFEEALGVAEDAEQRSGARTFRANSLDMLGRYREAVEAYEEVIRDSPSWWEAHANLGICHARNDRPDEAEAAFRRGLAACPGSPEVRDELAAHLLAEKRSPEEALRLAEEAVALGRDEVRHLQTLAEARLACGDEAGAEETFREVLDLDPENPDAHLELGLLCDRRGESAKAEEHFMESLKSDPSNPRALYSYASIYYASGDLETAEEILVRAVSSDASYSPALSALASIRARRGEYAASLDYLERAIEAGERDVEHFKAAVEFIPLRQDPRFRRLMLKMGDRPSPGGTQGSEA